MGSVYLCVCVPGHYSECVLQWRVIWSASRQQGRACVAYPTMSGCSRAQGSWQKCSRGPHRPSVIINCLPQSEKGRESKDGDWRAVWYQANRHMWLTVHVVYRSNNSTENKIMNENLLLLSGKNVDPESDWGQRQQRHCVLCNVPTGGGFILTSGK